MGNLTNRDCMFLANGSVAGILPAKNAGVTRRNAIQGVIVQVTPDRGVTTQPVC